MSIPGKQTINIGLPNQSANSDSLFEAFNKANTNFNTLFSCASPFSTFVANSGIDISANANTGVVTITNTGVTQLIPGTGVSLSGSNGVVIISATAGTSAGGTVTQLTSKSTSVTLNTITGEITMSNAQLSGDTTVSFTLNNSTIANTDVIILNQVSDANIGLYSFNGKCNSGNALISVHNLTNNNRSDAIIIRYAVIKGATS